MCQLWSLEHNAFLNSIVCVIVSDTTDYLSVLSLLSFRRLNEFVFFLAVCLSLIEWWLSAKIRKEYAPRNVLCMYVHKGKRKGPS